MKSAFRIVATAALGTALALASTAEAHSIWFAQRATQLALLYGIGADDLDSVKRLPLINKVAGYDADYRPVATQLRVAGPLLLVDSDEAPTVVTAAMDYGLWSKTPDGEWHKAGKDEVPTAQVSEHNFKYAVFLKAPLTKPLPAFADQVLQIVPVDAAIPQEMGKPLRVRVLYKGKPASGAVVQRDLLNDPDDAGQKTAADGTATIEIRNQGLNVLNATFVGPTDQPQKYDRMEYRATLGFVLPHAPE
jgi:uncharacterized GH25 family protein